MLNQEIITNALKSVKYPGYSRDIVSFGIIKNIALQAGAVSLSLQLTGGSPAVAGQIKADVEKALRAVPEVEQVQVEFITPAATGGRTKPSCRGSIAWWRWPAAREAWESPPSRSIWPALCNVWGCGWACWTAIFTARASR
jgi:metal-sulfur cluster biosynthetic enzyme